MKQDSFYLFRVYRFQDAEAYALLYDKYHQRINRYITMKMPSLNEAEELVSEVFLRGWDYATTNKVDNFNALLYRISRNLIADFYRSRVITGPIEEAEELLSTGHSLEEGVMIREEFRHIMQKLKLLKEEYQDILVMHYLDEMSIPEIASALQKKPNNVRVTLHRARKALKEVE